MYITQTCIITIRFIVICNNVSIKLEMILLGLWLISLFIQENIITLVINLEDELINTRTWNNYNRDKDKYRETQTPTPPSLASRLSWCWKTGPGSDCELFQITDKMKMGLQLVCQWVTLWHIVGFARVDARNWQD